MTPDLNGEADATRTSKRFDIDYCPDTLTHKHAWYLTTLASFMDGTISREDMKSNSTAKASSQACKCGQWRMIYFDKQTHVLVN